jgi:hypothetical protein
MIVLPISMVAFSVFAAGACIAGVISGLRD